MISTWSFKRFPDRLTDDLKNWNRIKWLSRPRLSNRGYFSTLSNTDRTMLGWNRSPFWVANSNQFRRRVFQCKHTSLPPSVWLLPSLQPTTNYNTGFAFHRRLALDSLSSNIWVLNELLLLTTRRGATALRLPYIGSGAAWESCSVNVYRTSRIVM